MSKFTLDLENNVKVTVYNTKRQIKRIIEKHNKANRNMVLGIIKFLRGELNPSNISSSVLSHNINDAKAFIPAYVSFGDGALYQLGYKISNNEYVTDITGVMQNIGNLTENKFSTMSLDRELVGNTLGNSTLENKNKVGRCAISKSAYSNDTTDSITLKLSAIIPPGYYTKNFYLDSNYRNARGTNNPIYLSELGLFSSDYDGSTNAYSGNLLARVTFNGTDDNMPIEQTDEDVLLVEWIIQITSIDDIYSQDNTTNIEWIE